MTHKRSQGSETGEPSSDALWIVGIGASAGGLEAFEHFFTNMPPDTTMAFVVVQHLDPNRKSMLVELLQRYTRMKVSQVIDKTKVEANQIYIIPPNRDMRLEDNVLHLIEPIGPRASRLAVDFFFRSLAEDQREKAIGVILSGTGADGTLGLQAIKGEGGMVMVQSPESSRYSGMPTNAINTSLVDFILPPEEMPQQLLRYIKHAHLRPLGVDADPHADRAARTARGIKGRDHEFFRRRHRVDGGEIAGERRKAFGVDRLDVEIALIEIAHPLLVRSCRRLDGRRLNDLLQSLFGAFREHRERAVARIFVGDGERLQPCAVHIIVKIVAGIDRSVHGGEVDAEIAESRRIRPRSLLVRGGGRRVFFLAGCEGEKGDPRKEVFFHRQLRQIDQGRHPL